MDDIQEVLMAQAQAGVESWGEAETRLSNTTNRVRQQWVRTYREARAQNISAKDAAAEAAKVFSAAGRAEIASRKSDMEESQSDSETSHGEQSDSSVTPPYVYLPKHQREAERRRAQGDPSGKARHALDQNRKDRWARKRLRQKVGQRDCVEEVPAALEKEDVARTVTSDSESNDEVRATRSKRKSVRIESSTDASDGELEECPRQNRKGDRMASTTHHTGASSSHQQGDDGTGCKSRGNNNGQRGEASEEQDGREAAEVDEAQASRSSVGMGGRASIKQGDDGTGCKSRGNDNRNKARGRKRQIQTHLHNREGEPEGDGGSRQKGFQEHGTADAPEGGMGSLAEKVSARNQHGGTGAVHKLHGSPSSLRS